MQRTAELFIMAEFL